MYQVGLSTSVWSTGIFSAHTATHSTSGSAHLIHIFFNKLLENKKPARFLLHQHLLIHQPNQKPEWGVVKADDSFIICFGFTIIPRAAAAFFQERAGAVFGEENTGGVDRAAHEDMPALHFFAERRKNGRHAINGEHPDGRLAGHFFVFFSAQRATSGP